MGARDGVLAATVVGFIAAFLAHVLALAMTRMIRPMGGVVGIDIRSCTRVDIHRVVGAFAGFSTCISHFCCSAGGGIILFADGGARAGRLGIWAISVSSGPGLMQRGGWADDTAPREHGQAFRLGKHWGRGLEFPDDPA